MPAPITLTERRSGHVRRAVPSPRPPASARPPQATSFADGLLLAFGGVYLVLATVLLAHDAPRPALLSFSFAVWALFLRDEASVGLPLFLLMAAMDVAVLSWSHWPLVWAGEIGPAESGLLLKAALLAGSVAWGSARKWRLDGPARRVAERAPLMRR